MNCTVRSVTGFTLMKSVLKSLELYISGILGPKAECFYILDINFDCNFAHECYEFAEKSVGLLHLLMSEEDAYPVILPL